jgi:FtsH-binding integral membrane protein
VPPRVQWLSPGRGGEIPAPRPAIAAPASARAAFIRRTYLHLLGAVLAFVGVEAALLSAGYGNEMLRTMQTFRWSWVGLMLLFVVGGMGAQLLARSRSAPGLQYAGLALYVLLEAVIFLPILTIATQSPQYAGKDLPLQAAVVTLAVFGGLTAAVFASGKDFSFLGPILWVGALVGLGVVVAAAIGGFSLGLVFCALMVALAAGYIIYDTSNVMHHFSTDMHVAASLELFASVALLFWYVLRIFMITSRDD